MLSVFQNLFSDIPLLLLLNRLFGFSGMLYAQPVTEAVMMAFSLMLLMHTIQKTEEQVIV